MKAKIATKAPRPRSLKRVVRRRWRDRKCELCNGLGTVPVTVIDVTADFECPRCSGTGNDGAWEPYLTQGMEKRVRKAVEADFQQWMTQSLTPDRGYMTPIDNVRALILELVPPNE